MSSRNTRTHARHARTRTHTHTRTVADGGDQLVLFRRHATARAVRTSRYGRLPKRGIKCRGRPVLPCLRRPNAVKVHRPWELGFRGQGVGLLQPGIGCRSVHSVRMGSDSGCMRRFSLLEESSTNASLLEESGTSASLLEESTERMWPVSARCPSRFGKCLPA